MKDRLVWAWADPGGVSGDGIGALVPWWSVTKVAIAAAALRLVGVAGLDAAQPEGFSLRALLQHTARLPDYGGLPEYRAAVAAGDPPWSEAELLARVGGPVGDRWVYSNVGYMLVRRAVERIAGAPLGAVLRDLVLEPLGLRVARIAESAADMAGTALPPPTGYHPGWVYHRCLIGPVGEAARMVAGIVAGDLLTPEARAAMADAVPVGGALPGRPWRRAGYGLGLMVGTLAEPGARPVAVLGHGAGGPGSAGCVFHFPELSRAPTVAVFGALADPGAAEWRCLEIAQEGGRTPTGDATRPG